MTTRMHVGYEVTGTVYDGGPENYDVSIPLHHTAITGLTRLSGKTTTIAALVSRLPEDFFALVFRTKRGEIAFPGAFDARPYYRPSVDWEYVQSLLEAAMNERLKFERSWIINATKGATTLREVYDNIQKARNGPRVRGLDESVYTNLSAYFEKILPELEENPFAEELVLRRGVNVMDLGHLSEPMQSLVISSCLEKAHESLTRTVIVIPEAWAFLPQARGNPVKWAAQHVIRQGGANELYLWLDSQDVTGIDKAILKSCGIWLLGRQQEVNEVKRVLDQIPVPRSLKPTADEVMTLPLGHFFVAAEDWCRKTYVQPAWLDDNGAFSVVTGVTSPEEHEPAMEVPMDDLTPTLAVPGQNVDDFMEEISRLSKQKEDLALGLAKSEAESAEWQDLARGNVDLLEQTVAKLGRLRDALMDVLEDPVREHQTPVHLEVSDQFLDQLASKVAERIDLSPRVVTLAPLEALRHQYQEEVVERMAEEIKEFEPRQREGLKWLLAVGTRCSAMEVCRNLGIPTAGGSYTAFNKGVKDLVEGDWVSQDNHGIKSNVYDKVEKALAIYNPTTEEIDQTYQRLVAELGQ